MTPFQISAPASEEFTAAVRWHETRRLGLGGEFYDATVRTIDLIRTHPEIGTLRTGRFPHRRLRVARFPLSTGFSQTWSDAGGGGRRAAFCPGAEGGVRSDAEWISATGGPLRRFVHLRAKALRIYLDRYAARCENFVLVVTRIAVLGARSAPRETGNQPRALSGYQGRSPWLVESSNSSIADDTISGLSRGKKCPAPATT